MKSAGIVMSMMGAVALKEADRRWGKWKMLVSRYIFEDLFWKRRTQKIEWMEKLIRC